MSSTSSTPSATATKLFAVYHHFRDGYALADPRQFDGLLIIRASDADEATQIVRDLMGSYFNNCDVEEIVSTPRPVVLEFWRIPPKRVDQQSRKKEVTT